MPNPSKALPQVATSWHEPALPAFSALCDEALRRCSTQHGLPVTPSDEMRLRAWQLCWLVLDAASAPANNLPDLADSQAWPPELVQRLGAAQELPKLNTQTWQELRRARDQQLFATLPHQGPAAADSTANEALTVTLTEVLGQLGLEKLRARLTPSITAMITRWLSACLLAVDAQALSDDNSDVTALDLIVFVQARLRQEHGAAATIDDTAQSEPELPAAVSVAKRAQEPAAAPAPQPAPVPAALEAKRAQDPAAAPAPQPAPVSAALEAKRVQKPAAAPAPQPEPSPAVIDAKRAQEPAAAPATQPEPSPAVVEAKRAQEPAAALAEPIRDVAASPNVPDAVEQPRSVSVGHAHAATRPSRSKQQAFVLFAGAAAAAAALLWMLRTGGGDPLPEAMPKPQVATPEPSARVATPEPPVAEAAPAVPQAKKQATITATHRPRYRNLAAAKRAHTAKKIDDVAYAAAIAELEAVRAAKIAKEQADLKSGKLSQQNYQRKVDAIDKSLGFDKR